MGFEVINALKKEKGLTNAQIAKMSGITLSTLDKITSGANTNPKLDTLQAICRVLGCTLDDFSEHPQKDKKTSPYSSEALQLADDYERQMDDRGRETVRGVADLEVARFKARTAATLRESREQLETAEEIAPGDSEKLVYVNPAAAGTPLLAESDFERLVFPPDKVPRGTDFGIRISGRSMEPTVMDGCIAWVRKQQEIPSGTVGIFMLNDSAVCKRFFKEDDGSIRLKSDNPNFPDVPVTEFDNFVLVGEVVGTV